MELAAEGADAGAGEGDGAGDAPLLGAFLAARRALISAAFAAAAALAAATGSTAGFARLTASPWSPGYGRFSGIIREGGRGCRVGVGEGARDGGQAGRRTDTLAIYARRSKQRVGQATLAKQETSVAGMRCSGGGRSRGECGTRTASVNCSEVTRRQGCGLARRQNRGATFWTSKNCPRCLGASHPSRSHCAQTSHTTRDAGAARASFKS